VGVNNARATIQPEQQIDMYILDFDRFHGKQPTKPTVVLNKKLALGSNPLR